MTIDNCRIYYYSLTGKTEALIESLDFQKTKFNDIKAENFQFGQEEYIIIGCPTYGRGAPPLFFKKILKEIRGLKDRKIILFGSGNTIYGDDFCGALDVLEELLKNKNQIIFKFKFEGYPTESKLNEFKNILRELK